MTHNVVDCHFSNDEYKNCLNAVKAADAATLIEATSKLTSDDKHRPAGIKTLREAIISEVERENTAHLVSVMEKLDASASKLNWLSVLLTFVGIFLGVIQILIVLKKMGT
ncbi:hypothetical protein V6x_54550 [Gimesia chilikensis]|uniref:Uncharacterized protein n=2 Tax=Gimesia chilikensis TaxID=2605989 RepID=A0A517WKD9_9PLAN|nr:hypothetical protein V6x_54550 [Gimesia chilikensis]